MQFLATVKFQQSGPDKPHILNEEKEEKVHNMGSIALRICVSIIWNISKGEQIRKQQMSAVRTRTRGWMAQWEKCIQTTEEDKDESHVMFVLKIDLRWNGIPIHCIDVRIVRRKTRERIYSSVCLSMYE